MLHMMNHAGSYLILSPIIPQGSSSPDNNPLIAPGYALKITGSGDWPVMCCH